MSIFRLLPFSLVIAVGVATLTAQSSPSRIPSNILPGNTEWLDSSTSTNLPSPNLQAELNPQDPLDRIHIGDYNPRLNRFGGPHVLLHTEPDSQSDNVCLKMRTYKVARDGPKTDSTHPSGYSTCQPAARFQMHTAEFKVPVTP